LKRLNSPQTMELGMASDGAIPLPGSLPSPFVSQRAQALWGGDTTLRAIQATWGSRFLWADRDPSGPRALWALRSRSAPAVPMAAGD
jgi:hypothetical protein